MENEKVIKDMIETSEERFKKNGNLGDFWRVMQYLVRSNILIEDGDYKVICKDKIIHRYYEHGEWLAKEKLFDQPCRLLYLNTARVHSLYKAHCLILTGQKPMPASTLKFYLTNPGTPELVCETKKESFQKIDPSTGKQECNELGVKKRTSTSALIFEMEKTGLQLGTSFD